MSQYNASRKETTLFSMMRQYINIVMEMMLFIGAVLTGDWELQILICPRQICLRLNDPRVRGSMRSIKQTDLEIYQEFAQGNWVVNKNKTTPFCSVTLSTQ
jgi:hypothetical protein